MTDQSLTVFQDDTVSTAVLSIIREAKREVILVSPYNKFWNHLRDAITLALRRNVVVTAIYRQDQRGEDARDLEWLVGLGAQVYSVDNLHAKIFLNESSLVITSMNLLESSSKNSKEIALQITDGPASSEIRAYIRNQLIPLGRLMPSAAAPGQSVSNNRRSTTNAQPVRSTRRPVAQPKTVGGVIGTIIKAIVGSHCIRCNTVIGYDLSKPLCRDCFAIWNQHQNREYPEKHCHRCGRDVQTTLEKPLCRSCYQAANA